MVLVWTPPPHAKACVSSNCDTNARIKFIFDTAIDDLEWKNPVDFWENRKNQNGHLVKIWWKGLCNPYFNQKCTNQFHIIEGGTYRFWQNRDPKWQLVAILNKNMAPAAILWIQFQKIKLRIDLKWREMWSKVIFGLKKWPRAAIL